MSTGLDAYISQDNEGRFFFGIEDPMSNSLDPDYIEEGPFTTVEALHQAFNRHANPGGWSIELAVMDYDEFDRQWDALTDRMYNRR